MSLSEMLQILWARKVRFLLVLVLCVAGTIAVSLQLPKTYVAQSALVINSTGRDALTGLVNPTQLSPNSIPTQVDIIASHNVALKVVDSLKLTQVQTVEDQFREATGGQGSIRDWLADRLLSRLTVRPSRDSNVVVVEFAATDSRFAAELANAFAEAYIQASLELSMDPARRQTGWFDGQLLQLRQKLQEAKQRLSEYQQQKNIVATDDRVDIESAKLAEVASQLVAAQAAMYDTKSREQQMTKALESGQIEELPDILGNSLLQNMKADRTRAEAKLAEAAERYGRNHPQYISAAAEVQSLKSKFESELRTARGAIKQSAQLAEQRVKELQRAQDKQKKDILGLKDQRNGLDVLNRDVDSAQRTFDAATARANEVRLQSEMNQSTVSVLNRAFPPNQPAGPQVLLNATLALIVGLLLGTAVALGSERLDRRVRSAESLAEGAGLMVLGELPKTRDSRKRKSRKKTPVPEVAAAQPA